MSEKTPVKKSRREFLKDTSRYAAASMLATASFPGFHPGEDNTIRIALVGCGGRGTGAVINALATEAGPVELVAMADVFEDRLQKSFDALAERRPDQLDVPRERRFLGFDAYRHAMDALRPGDVVILATPPAFRWVHFGYAVERGLNVFMEKPVTVDAPTSVRMLELAEAADAKNLKVGVGLMVRHCRGRQELKERIDAGEIGEIITLRAYRMQGPAGSCFTKPKTDDLSLLKHQVRRFHSYIWASGGLFSDFYIHQIDECCWMKGSWPVEAHASGGRHYRGDFIDQNFDNYTVEYTFADGAKLFLYGRTMEGSHHHQMSSFAHGTTGQAVISSSGHTPGRVRIYHGQSMEGVRPVWAFPQPEPNPYQLEWEDLMQAIRKDEPFNEVKRGVEASLVTSMGRMAAHTGQVVRLDDMWRVEHEMAPGLDLLTEDSPAPLQPLADGSYPQPQPGIKVYREY